MSESQSKETDVESHPTTLTYWNGRGLCETIRLMLAATGEEYKEAVPGFPECRHLSEPEHLAFLRANGYLMFDQVPLLCIDGLKLVQSQAIVRYLARKHGLNGQSAADQVRIDMVAETILDWRRGIGIAFEYSFNAHEPSQEQRATLAAGNARFLPRLEKILLQNGQVFFVGATASYADILALEPLEQIAPYEDLSEYPSMRALHANLKGMPRLSAWLQSNLRKSKTQEGVAEYKRLVAHTLGR